MKSNAGQYYPLAVSSIKNIVFHFSQMTCQFSFASIFALDFHLCWFQAKSLFRTNSAMTRFFTSYFPLMHAFTRIETYHAIWKAFATIDKNIYFVTSSGCFFPNSSRVENPQNITLTLWKFLEVKMWNPVEYT